MPSRSRTADKAETFRTAVDDLADKLNSGQELPHRFQKSDPERLQGRLVRGRSDADFRINERFGWRGGTVIAWSGMRGAVTVAAAQTLPSDTPYRPQLLLIAFTVATATLLLQGLTLPWVIRRLWVDGDDEAADRAALGELYAAMTDEVTDALADPSLTMADGTPFDPVIREQVRTWTEGRRRYHSPRGRPGGRQPPRAVSGTDACRSRRPAERPALPPVQRHVQLPCPVPGPVHDRQ